MRGFSRGAMFMSMLSPCKGMRVQGAKYPRNAEYSLVSRARGTRCMYIDSIVTLLLHSSVHSQCKRRGVADAIIWRSYAMESGDLGGWVGNTSLVPSTCRVVLAPPSNVSTKREKNAREGGDKIHGAKSDEGFIRRRTLN